MHDDPRLSELTIDQKVALLSGVDSWHTASFESPSVPAIRMSDGPAGVRGTSWDGPRSASFPCGAALGATFDAGLVAEVGRALAREARTKGANVLLGPTVNLHRTPIGGRNFECLSEDPLLTAELGAAYVSGVQAPVDGAARVAACVKHLVANDTEYQRMTISSEVAEAVLRELYLVPFETIVAGGVRAVMSAYNRLNGTFCGEHPWLLTTVLRDEWGFDGLVISDWFGCHSAAASLRAGLDVEMPGPPVQRGDRLRAALDAGEASEEDLDRAVRRVLALADWTSAAATDPTEAADIDDATREVIHRAATCSAVLLKNAPVERDAGEAVLQSLPTPSGQPAGEAPALHEPGRSRTRSRGGTAGSTVSPLLPLAPGRRLALIGPYAEHGRPQGGGSAGVNLEPRPGPLAALRDHGFDVSFATGGSIAKFLEPIDARLSDGPFTVDYADDAGHTLAATAERLRWGWHEPPAADGAASPFDGPNFGAVISGGFVPDTSGRWMIGAQSVGPCEVRLDGEVVVAVAPGQSGGAFFGMGSPELRAEVEVEAGRRYEVRIEYPVSEGHHLRGLAVGAAPVPVGDPIAAAAASAAAAEIAVVIVGTDDRWETEGEDRTTLVLPGHQDALVAAVAAANPNTVVVINAGSPVSMRWLDEVAAVLQIWFPGQELGPALVDVLTGAADPGGRLPVTFPASLDETPAAPYYPGVDGNAVYGEGLLIGYRWYDRVDVEPLFPFGYGLSYTTFDLVAAGVRGDTVAGAVATCEVTNTGDRRGAEVVQVYVEPPDDLPDRPRRTLGGFAKVHLEPGESARVEVPVAPRAFARWSDDGWAVPPGTHRLVAGRNSRDLAPVGTVTA